ncbi:metallophosphoesterase [Streptomyces sp. NBC_01614]|uniref:Metallophosphoesterase n=1 Tax=Streptomyces sp. NBC_00180 TaxID=2903632 RepID=A0AAU1I9Q0_9ACTN
MLIAHVSDLHIGGSEDSVERAMRVREYLNGLPGPVDAVMVTGDIADHGLADEYTIAREVMRYDAPTIVCPGNHDSRTAFRTVLLGQSGHGPINQVLRLEGLTIALCDSSIPGRVHADEHGWLESELDRAEGPMLQDLLQPVGVGQPYGVDRGQAEAYGRVGSSPP